LEAFRDRIERNSIIPLAALAGAEEVQLGTSLATTRDSAWRAVLASSSISAGAPYRLVATGFGMLTAARASSLS
jgi:hypothetical protein